MDDSSDAGAVDERGGPTPTAYVVVGCLVVAVALRFGGGAAFTPFAVAAAGVGVGVLLVRVATVDAADDGEEDGAAAGMTDRAAGEGASSAEASDKDSERARRDKEMSAGDGHTV